MGSYKACLKTHDAAGISSSGDWALTWDKWTCRAEQWCFWTKKKVLPSRYSFLGQKRLNLVKVDPWMVIGGLEGLDTGASEPKRKSFSAGIPHAAAISSGESWAFHRYSICFFMQSNTFFTRVFSHNSRTRTFIFIKILVRDLSDFGFITNFWLIITLIAKSRLRLLLGSLRLGKKW